MNKEHTSIAIAVKVWFYTSLVFGLGWVVYCLLKGEGFNACFGIIAGIAASIASLPVLVILSMILPLIKNYVPSSKMIVLVFVCLGICIVYGLVGTTFTSSVGSSNFLETFYNYSSILFGCSTLAILICNKDISTYFNINPIATLNESWQQDSTPQNNTIIMETTNYQPSNSWNNNNSSSISSNKTVVKAIIVAVLTLAMLIPTTLISNMIIERQGNNSAYERISNVKPEQVKAIVAKNYEKTMRTTKYAVLVIGLTFAIFFLIEIMHKKPVHPVQYTLVGLALAIFYTLLLSIGEYILFDYAYIISATATIMLITMYVKSHFQNWKAASALGGVLTSLYGFILVLVSLEDTALIVGSIGLFIVLAIVMYTTRNINWYNPSLPKETEALG